MNSPNVDVLKQWAQENEPSDSMRYKKSYLHMISFMRGELFMHPFYKLAGDAEVCECTIVGTHRSKSIELPVVKYTYVSEFASVEVIVSYNFHMWSVTVRSSHDIPDAVNALDMMDSSYSFMYGFNSEDCLGKYEDNPREFSVTLHDHNEMWALMRIIRVMIQKAGVPAEL